MKISDDVARAHKMTKLIDNTRLANQIMAAVRDFEARYPNQKPRTVIHLGQKERSTLTFNVQEHVITPSQMCGVPVKFVDEESHISVGELIK